MTEIDGESYRTLREAAGLSRKELATQAGVPYSAVASLERGARPRGGDEIVEAVDRELKLTTGVRVADTERIHEVTFLEPGDVITAQREGQEELLLKVRRVNPDREEVECVELVIETGDHLKEALRYGASTFRHNGRVYLQRHVRTVRMSEVLRRWTQEEKLPSATVVGVEEQGDEDAEQGRV